MAPNAAADSRSLSFATLRVREVRPEFAVLEVPGTEYQLHLAVDPASAANTLAAGKRIDGEIHASALRMHRSDTGGRFIEPIYGQPRIVQGEVIAVDEPGRRVLMDMAVPVWMAVQATQDLSAIHPGELWNCYVQSGTRFEPAG